jgi:CDP-paratose 2-epimerase
MSRQTLITGGAGFIGTNLAHRLLTAGESVLLFDNLSRPGVRQNFEWLREMHGAPVRLQVGDVRDRRALRQAIGGSAQVYHLAAQVAVTTSLSNPSDDFDINARGALNVLEELRLLHDPPPLVFTSTSKVYGVLGDIELRRSGERYEPSDPGILERGFGEDRPLEFHSPYACSKGAADQYVLDYARYFGLAAVVFRLSTVYGAHEGGTADQGWVSHFLMRTITGQPVTLYGDGKQVRDLLFVDDLVDALLLAQSEIRSLSGQAFNIGGGPHNSASLVELLRFVTEISGELPLVRYGSWRPGDQRYYVSDTARFHAATGWEPRTGIREGVTKLHGWLGESPGARVA